MNRVRTSYLTGIAGIAMVVALAPLPGLSAFATQAPHCLGKPATIIGTEGDDVLLGTNGDDVIVGLGGNDILGQATIGSDAGTQGDDRICGGDGEDTLYGGDGADMLDGGLKDDILIGGRGPDLLRGKVLDDVIYPDGYKHSPCSDTANDTVEGGVDHDMVVYDTECSPPMHIDLTAGVATGQGTDSLTLMDSAKTGPGNDVIVGTSIKNRLYGGGGDDTISGLAGDDYLDGQRGTDSLDGGDGTDTCVNGENDLNCELLGVWRLSGRGEPS